MGRQVIKISDANICEMVKESVMRILNEVYSQDNIDEHKDVVDNLLDAKDVIKSQWSSPDDLWIINIDERKKDRILQAIRAGNPIKGSFHRRDKNSPLNANHVGYGYIYGNNADEAVKSLENIIIYLFPWASKEFNTDKLSSNGNSEAIYNACDQFYARAYMTFNKRSKQKVADASKTDNMNDIFFLKNALKADNGLNSGNLWYMIDCDIDDENGQKELEDRLAEYGIHYDKKMESHNGMHYFFSTPNVSKVDLSGINAKYIDLTQNKAGDPPVIVKSDGKLLLYSPCGK